MVALGSSQQIFPNVTFDVLSFHIFQITKRDEHTACANIVQWRAHFDWGYAAGDGTVRRLIHKQQTVFTQPAMFACVVTAVMTDKSKICLG